MSEAVNKIIAEAFLLPREDRTELVDQLLTSLNGPVSEELDRMWAEESEKRVKEIEEGKIKALDGEKVFKEIKNRIQS